MSPTVPEPDDRAEATCPAPAGLGRAAHASVQRAVQAHAEYVQLCEARCLTPLPFGLQWSMITEMWSLGPQVIPYISGAGTVWVRDLRHKTGRKDRPWEFANLTALQGQPRTRPG